MASLFIGMNRPNCEKKLDCTSYLRGSMGGGSVRPDSGVRGGAY